MSANDNGVVVRIVGDATGVQPAVDSTEASLGGLESIVADLSAQVSALTAKMTDGFAAGAASGKALASGMNEARVATEGESNALTAMIMKVHEGAESVRTFQMRAKEFAELYVAMFGIEAIAHWAESMGEAAEKLEHLSAETGMTTGQLQALSGAAQMSGTNIDMLTKGLAMMANRSVTVTTNTTSSAKALKAMGISANDGTTNMQRLLTIADKFHDMADGPQKAALAMQLFGRSGREMIPFLNQGSAAIEQLMQKTKDYGAANEAAQAQGERLADSVNEAKVAWVGLKETLAEAFGPVLTELIDGFSAMVQAMHESYESGGIVKIIFEAISEVAQGLGEMIGALGLYFSTLFETTKTQGLDWGMVIKVVIEGVVDAFKTCVAIAMFVADAFIAAFHLAKGAAESFLAGFTEDTGQIRVLGTGLGEFMKVVGKVCYDALHLDWGDIKSDWANGMEQVHQAVAAKAQEIVGEVDKMKNAVKQDFSDMMGTGKSFTDFLDKLRDGPGAPKHDDFKFKFGGGSDDVPDIKSSNAGRGKKGKKSKDDLVQELDAELQAKKDAWDAEQVAQDTAEAYSLQDEAAFWKSKLNLADASSKDKQKILEKYLKAEQAVQKQAEEEKLAAMKKTIAADAEGSQKKIQDLQAYVIEVKHFYGAASKEAQAAEKEMADAAKKAAEDKKKALEDYYNTEKTLALGQVARAEENAKFEVELGIKSKGDLLAAQRDFENQRYQIEFAALQRRLELLKNDPTTSKEALQKIYDQIEILEQQHQNKLIQIDQQAALQRTQIERQAIDQVSKSWADAIGKMITLQQSFAATIKSIWQTVQQAIGSAIASILADFLKKQLTALIIGKGQKTAEAAGEINANAATAASGAYAATAAIPVVGPELAPAAAASAYAGAISWLGSLSMNAFDVGAWNLSKDQIAMVHAGEMIIPAELAGGMRGFFQSVNDNGRPTANDGGSGGDGSPHLHFHGPIIGSRSAMEQWARENRHMFGAGMRAFVRGGGSADPYRTR